MYNNMKKFALTLLLVLGNAAFALADDVKFSIGMDNSTFTIGESKTVELKVENDVDIIGIQCDITVPEGIEIDASSVARAGRLTRAHTPYLVSQGAGVYRLLVTSASKTVIGGTSGDAVVTFQMTANNKIKSKGNLTITGATATTVREGENTEILVPDWSTTIYKQAKLDGEVTFYAEEESFQIKAGEEHTISLIFDNEPANLTGMSGRISLPEGLTIVPGVDGPLGYTDRIQNDAELSYNPATGKFSFISMSATPIPGNSGTLFTFTVKADENLAEESEIKLTEIAIVDLAANDFPLPDVIIKVQDQAAIEAAEAEAAAADEAQTAINDLQERLNNAVPEAVADNEEVLAAKDAAQNAVTAAQTALDDAEAVKDNEDVAKAIADAEAAIEDLEAAVAAAEAAAEAAAVEAAAVEAAQNDITALQDRVDNAVPEEVAADEEVIAAIEAAQNAVTAAQKALDEAEAVKDNEDVAKAIADAEAAVENLETVVADAVKAYEEQKAAEEAAQQALDEAKAIADQALKEIEDYARTQKNVFTGTTPDVSGEFLAQVDQLVEDLKQAVENAYADGTLTDDFVDVNEVKDQIDAVYANALKAQNAYTELKGEIADLQNALDELKAIDLTDADEEAAQKVEDQIGILQDELNKATQALEDNKAGAADTDLETLLGESADDFLAKVADLTEQAEELIFVLGDLDGDKRVTAADVRVFINAYLSGDLPEAGSEQFEAYDVNKDGHLTPADAQMLRDIVIGKK